MCRAQPLCITWLSIGLLGSHLSPGHNARKVPATHTAGSRQPNPTTHTLVCPSPGLLLAPAVLPVAAVGPGATAPSRTSPCSTHLGVGACACQLCCRHAHPRWFKGHLSAPSLRPVMEDSLVSEIRPPRAVTQLLGVVRALGCPSGPWPAPPGPPKAATEALVTKASHRWIPDIQGRGRASTLRWWEGLDLGVSSHPPPPRAQPRGRLISY